MKSDADFDGIARSFEADIYGSSKGHTRLSVLWEDLKCEVPGLSRGELSILDAGGGAGHMALTMAQSGNNVLLCDPSREMLLKAEEAVGKVSLPGSVTTLHSSIQDLEEAVHGKFDVVACHAVLEWLSDPRETLGHLVEFLKYEGRLSLMFYNRNATLIKKIFSGELSTALQEYEEGFAPRGWGQGATPLAEEDVRRWLGELGLEVCSKAGIRIFHDHVPGSARKPDQLEALLDVEKRLRNKEPFASLGQHIHLVCRWKQRR